ncbi:MAG: hypothetical protein WDO71_26795 [Bacteroidota bacterium]
MQKLTVFKQELIHGKRNSSWPPKNTEIKKLYANANHTAGFAKPSSSKASVSYVSDPATPVPYRSLPIEATYGPGSRWESWHVEDQRFVSSRPDVVSFTARQFKRRYDHHRENHGTSFCKHYCY